MKEMRELACRYLEKKNISGRGNIQSKSIRQEPARSVKLEGGRSDWGRVRERVKSRR